MAHIAIACPLDEAWDSPFFADTGYGAEAGAGIDERLCVQYRIKSR